MLKKKKLEKKTQKRSFKNKEYKIKKSILNYGTLGLKSLSKGFISSKQIESARKTISKAFKNVGFIWIRCVPDLPLTKQKKGLRMGKGKGEIENIVFKAKQGSVIFEIIYFGKGLKIRKELIGAIYKLPIKLKIIS